MTEEIKEIDIKKDLYLCSPLLNKECTKENCYINNGCCCHTVNKKYSQEHLLNYITNLQKENEKLKERCDYLQRSCDRKEEQRDDARAEYMEQEDYKSRNEKAVEYIRKYLQEHIIDDLPDEESKFELENGTPIPNAKEILLNILEGGDE